MIDRSSRTSKRHEQGGFTLIELLVVIIILGILSAVVVFAVRGTGKKGKDEAINIDKRTLATAQEAHCAQFGTYTTEDDLVAKQLLSEKSTYNDFQFIGGAKCGNDPLFSGYLITGDAATRTPNDTFVIGSGSYTPKEGLNPAINTAGGMQAASGMLFNGLVGLAPNASPVPELAEPVPTVANGGITNGGATYKFTLRDPVLWSDGQPLKAEDVKFSYEAALLIHHARTASSLPSAFATACTPASGSGPSRRLTCPSIVANENDGGKKTVTFNFAKPFGSLLQQMPMSDGAIIPSHIFPGCTSGVSGPEGTCPTSTQAWPTGQPPVGTGPFKVNFAESTPAGGLVYDKNTNYWRKVNGEAIPYFNKVKLSLLTGLAALQAGTIDYLPGLGSIEDVNAAKADRNLVVDTGTMAPGGSTNCTQTLMFNLWAQGQTPAAIRGNTASAHPQLGDKAAPMIDPDDGGPEPAQPRGQVVRRAIAMSLEREPNVKGPGTNAGYVSISKSPGAELAQSPTNTGMPVGSTPAPLPGYDKAKAMAFLDKAGFPDTNGDAAGGRFTLGLSSFVSQQLADALQADMRAVGIEVTNNPSVSTKIQISLPEVNTLFRDRNFDIVFVSSCQNTDPEMGTRRVYHVDAINGAPFTNGSGYNNPTINALFNTGRESIDPAVRNQAYKQINDTVGRELPTLWLLQTKSNRAYKATCSGLRPYTGAYPEYGSCVR